MADKKLKTLVLFGGRSPEHDVSIITGLQCLKALDPTRYDAFPLYVAPDGTWYVGEALRDRANYIPGKAVQSGLTKVTLDMTPGMGPALVTLSNSRWRKAERIPFDVAFPAFHGLFGEDGGIQGMFEVANIPYTGMRLLASSILMDKAATKKALAGTAVPVLPCHEIKRPMQGLLVTPDELKTKLGNIAFPCCIKPAHLGSSIGVAQVKTLQEVSDVLAGSIFRYDDTALLEPFVENLVEYNVSVRWYKGELVTSAIERPKMSSELLDFKTKYMSGGGTKKMGGTKSPSQSSEGMLSLTRDINPELSAEFEGKIRAWAKEVYLSVGGTGAPRLDFLCNGKTNEVWFNEANPLPGSVGYFLWEAAKDGNALFSELLDQLIDEALMLHSRAQIPLDPTPEDARLFPRR
jgi:D-alanine-D-alanine ligase